MRHRRADHEGAASVFGYTRGQLEEPEGVGSDRDLGSQGTAPVADGDAHRTTRDALGVLRPLEPTEQHDAAAGPRLVGCRAQREALGGGDLNGQFEAPQGARS